MNLSASAFKVLAVCLVILTGFTAASTAYAITPNGIFDQPSSKINILDDRYRIGDEWGKKPVRAEDLNSNVHFRRMALATAKIRSGGTGFYLGNFEGIHLVATNHHVCPSEWRCGSGNTVIFPQLNVRVRINKFYGSWPEIDLAIFSVESTSITDLAALESVASPFAFTKDLYRGQKLVTIGFGVANNGGGALMANRDSDCVVFSGDAEYRVMSDPDELNPGTYDVWSFANGCDVSHGDSGSAMMDRESGQVIGLIWTGRIPKSKKVQSSGYLNQLLAAPTEEVWQELSYGVPAVKIKPFLLSKIEAGEVARDLLLMF